MKRRWRGRAAACLCAVMIGLSPGASFGAESLSQETTPQTEQMTVQDAQPADHDGEQSVSDRNDPFAEDVCPELVRADSLEEYIDLTPAQVSGAAFDVDASTGRISGTEEDLSFEETFGEPFDQVRGSREEVTETINDTEGYQVEAGSGKTLHVLSDYGLHRVMVNGEIRDPCGAQSAVIYRGETQLTYDSEESTKRGYEELKEIYGEENVMLDHVMSLADTAKEAGKASKGTAQEEADESFYGWGTKAMYLDSVKKKYAGSGRKVTVAVLDTGIDATHEIFRDTTILSASRNFVDPYASCTDDHGHGTMVSGIIAESTPSNVRLLVLKVMNDRGDASWLSVRQAMMYAAEQHAGVINLSLGNYYSAENCAVMDTVMSDIASRGILICAASGNKGKNLTDSDGKLFYPASSPYVISIGAMDKSGKRASFSNYGKALDFTAPGEGLTLALYGSRSGYRTGVNGTSFASPYICACAADLLMMNTKNTRDTTYGQLQQISQDLGSRGKDKYYGFGMPSFANDGNLNPIRIDGKVKVSLTATKFVYDGKEKKPAVTRVSYKGRTLTSYKVSYSKRTGTIGTHKVTVRLVGNYSEPVKVCRTYKVVPKKPTINVYKSRFYGKGKAGIVWSRSQGTYQIRVSSNKAFRGAKSCRSKKTYKVIKGLRTGRTYYIKVRAVKKVNGRNYYSDWSQIVYGKIPRPCR